MRLCFVILLFLITRCSSLSDSSSLIPYPAAPRKDSVANFLPGIVSKPGDSVDFNAAFSPDGKSFYFSRTQNRQWDILLTRYEHGSWSAPRVLFENYQYSECDPAFGPDGSLYFISNAPKDTNDTIPDFDIWFVRPQENGGWSDPENLKEVNTDSTEYYVSFAGDGNMYFASSRAGGFGDVDLYVSRRVDGRYTIPENLGANVNTPDADHDPALPKNEKFIIYTINGDNHYSIRMPDGSWSPKKPLDKLNTSTYEYCNYFSPDYRYFFFSSRYDVRWTPTESLPEELFELIGQ